MLYGCLRELMRGDDYKHLMTIGNLGIRKANNLYISFIFAIIYFILFHVRFMGVCVSR